MGAAGLVGSGLVSSNLVCGEMERRGQLVLAPSHPSMQLTPVWDLPDLLTYRNCLPTWQHPADLLTLLTLLFC
jgi:hypothetical protein